MDKITLNAQERKIVGRKVKTLRAEGILPATVYGKKIASSAIQVNLKEFEEIFKKAGETTIVSLQLNQKDKPVLIHNIQKHPVVFEPIHVDFLQVDLKTKIEAEVPIELVGESPAQKSGIGTVVTQLNEITVEALPLDLPEKFEIDISNLTEVDQAIFVKDLKWDKDKVEVKTDLEQIIIKVEPPQKEEVIIAPVAETPAEGEEPKPTEGVEGEAAPVTEAPKA